MTLEITIPNIASIILNLMSRKKLGNKQIIILPNCINNDQRYDLLITPHRQTIGYIRRKTEIQRKIIINKQTKIIRKRFSVQRNAFSESETSAIQELYNIKDSIDKNHLIDNQICVSESETTSPASIKGKRRIKKSYTNKPMRMYNWNQPKRHIKNYTLRVIQHKSD